MVDYWHLFSLLAKNNPCCSLMYTRHEWTKNGMFKGSNCLYTSSLVCIVLSMCPLPLNAAACLHVYSLTVVTNFAKWGIWGHSNSTKRQTIIYHTCQKFCRILLVYLLRLATHNDLTQRQPRLSVIWVPVCRSFEFPAFFTCGLSRKHWRRLRGESTCNVVKLELHWPLTTQEMVYMMYMWKFREMGVPPNHPFS